MRAFVTGATGFIGGHMARKLLERGYAVTCLVRDPAGEPAGRLRNQGATIIHGDITEPETMRQAMEGAEVLFHIAAWYKIGAADPTPALSINAQGTRNVLELALQLDIPNVVYTSTVGVFGNTRGRVVDENYHRNSPFGSHYTRSKTMAHEIAEELIVQGVPIRIVMPGAVYGPGDQSVLALLLRAYLRGLFPVVPGADSGISLVHVEDVAEGHILAAEKGQPGKYVLAGPSLTYGEMLRLVAQIAGRPAPLLLSSWPVPALIQLTKFINRFFPLPPTLHPETLQNMNRFTFWASGAKAQRELGWRARPLREGMEETIAWELNHSIIE